VEAISFATIRGVVPEMFLYFPTNGTSSASTSLSWALYQPIFFQYLPILHKTQGSRVLVVAFVEDQEFEVFHPLGATQGKDTQMEYEASALTRMLESM